MKLRMSLLAAAVLALAIVVAGCGGGEDATTDALTTSSLNKSAYVKRVNALCKEGNKKMMTSMLKYGLAHPQGTKQEAAGRAIQHAIPAGLEAQLEEIRALGAPSGDEAQVAAYLAALEDTVAKVKEDEPTDIFQLQEALVTVDRPASSYGLDDCKF